MFGAFRQKRTVLRSSDELRNVDMNVFTKASGPIGSILGRDLRLRVDQFEFHVEPSAEGGSGKTLKEVRVLAGSLCAVSEVNAAKFDRLMLTFDEADKVNRRTEGMLDAERHPVISFVPQDETETSIGGTLTLRGASNYITCSKTKEGPELVVRCPFDFTKFDVPRHQHLLGLLAVHPEVEVAVRVPTSLL